MVQSDPKSTNDATPRDHTVGGFVLTNPEAELHEPQSVGELLGAGRVLAGLSIAEVANRLRMSIKQVDALERGQYELLPSGTFLRGFVRNYAKAVGVDIETALRVLERTHTDAHALSATPVLAPAGLAAPVSFQAGGESLATPTSRAIIAVLLLACLAVVVWYWWHFVRPHLADGGRPAEKEAVVQPTLLPALPSATATAGSTVDSTSAQDPTPVAGATVAGIRSGGATNTDRDTNAPPVESKRTIPGSPSPSPPPPPNTTSARPQAAPDITSLSQTQLTSQKLPVVVTAANEKDANSKRAGETGVIGFTFSGESWVEVVDGGGRTVISRRYAAGEADEVAGRGPFSVVVGNAQATRMAYNGREFDLAPHTQSAVARVTVK
ncbi:MAG: helix-turn-helix domain-containing protein [Burkholderiales bacterium]